jgi:sigma-B regulation protein RsbU (phosphoserine phosphatase)
VVGKGVGAGLLMVLTQTFLNSRLHSGDDPADAVSALNRHLHDRTGLQQFVSMWVGVVDAAARRVTYVDAGHGYAMMLAPGAEPETLSKNKGMVLGVERNIEFTSSTCEMPAGSRIVVYSDGVIEQPGDAGGRFGQERVMSHLSPSGDPAEDVESVALALAAFAGGRVYADDVTIVSAVIAADSSGTG